MSQDRSAKDYFPDKITLTTLRNAAQHCRGCDLYKNAIQTVFGEGAAKAKMMIVGEIPGLKEDIEGKPFVGPAGALLRKIIQEAGFHHKNIYYTNVVKHFKFSYMNKKKLHRTPTRKEVKACRPWIDAEIHLIKPAAILCLGATAAKALLNKEISIKTTRGKWLTQQAPAILVTYHPSAILRAPDSESRHLLKRMLAADIKKTARYVSNHALVV